MIKLTIANVLGQSNDILDLKKEYDETLKNIPTVGEHLLRITRRGMKIALII